MLGYVKIEEEKERKRMKENRRIEGRRNRCAENKRRGRWKKGGIKGKEKGEEGRV